MFLLRIDVFKKVNHSNTKRYHKSFIVWNSVSVSQPSYNGSQQQQQQQHKAAASVPTSQDYNWRTSPVQYILTPRLYTTVDGRQEGAPGLSEKGGHHWDWLRGRFGEARAGGRGGRDELLQYLYLHNLVHFTIYYYLRLWKKSNRKIRKIQKYFTI